MLQSHVWKYVSMIGFVLMIVAAFRVVFTGSFALPSFNVFLSALENQSFSLVYEFRDDAFYFGNAAIKLGNGMGSVMIPYNSLVGISIDSWSSFWSAVGKFFTAFGESFVGFFKAMGIFFEMIGTAFVIMGRAIALPFRIIYFFFYDLLSLPVGEEFVPCPDDLGSWCDLIPSIVF